jgi:anti-anti-sigma regulatory factor
LVFSLFGKKPDKKSDKAPVQKAPARKPAASAGRLPDPGPRTEDGLSLDFTNYVPPGGQAGVGKPAPPAARHVDEDPVSLDFGSLAAELAANSSVSRGTEAHAELKAPPPQAKKKGKQPLDSVLCIEVEEGAGHDIPPAIEEAAILFANGQGEEALARAKKALDVEDLGVWKLQMWLMLFDLLQHLGRKQEFEERALDFVVKFERSPPMWVDPPTESVRQNPSMRTGGGAHVALSGALGAQSAAALEQLKKAADRQPKLRLDFAKLQSIEPAGCTLLRDTLRGFKAAKKEFYLTGEDRILKLLRDEAKPGDASIDSAVWLLLLDLYQMLGLQAEFEEAAVDYAVTFEVQPPRKKVEAMDMSQSQPLTLDTGDEAFHVVGEIAGQSDQLFNDIASYAGNANPVMLDFFATKRIDFVNAGRLLNVLEKQKAEGKQLVIRSAREMIIALFAVMGIPKVARIIPRK